MGLFPKLSFFFPSEPQFSGESGRSGISREEPTVMRVWVCSYFPSPVTASAKTLGLRPWLVLRARYRRSVGELLLKN